MRKDKPSGMFSPTMLWLGGLMGVGIVLLLLLRHSNEAASETTTAKAAAKTSASSSSALWPGPIRHAPSAATNAESAEAILSRKMTQFSKKQRAIFEALAKKHNATVPDAVKRFFDAVDAGDWNQVQAIYKTLHDPQSISSPGSEDLRPFWRPIQDTYGAMEMAQEMPAQEYLNYGNSVLGSLKPGMIYVGGTDSGMFIPNMMNATSDEQHVVLTQNALADPSYIEYLNFLYGDQLKMLTADQNQQAFSKYMEDAQRRLQHDQQFPDQPKQVLPGENISQDATGKVSVSGQVAIMSINDNLFQTLMQQNPDLTFGMEQSYPFKSTFSGATPLGPIMQLGAPGSSSGFTADTAQQAVSYWQTTTQQLLADPQAAGSSATLLSYSHDATTQADMLAAHDYSTEAEQAYNLASQLSPTNFDAIAGLSTVLYQNGKSDQAIQILNDFAQKNPTQQAAVDRQRTTLAAKAK